MKLITLIGLMLVSQLAFSQGCPSSTTIDGHEFQVVQIGNQCFYVDNTGYFLNQKFASIQGQRFQNTINSGEVVAIVQNGSITNYLYTYSIGSCAPREQINLSFLINLGMEIDLPVVGQTESDVQITGSALLTRTYSSQLVASGGEINTVVQLTSTHVDNHDVDLQISNSLLNGIANLLEDLFLEQIIIPQLLPTFSGEITTIQKLNDQIIPLQAEITGPSAICKDPVTLSVSPPDLRSYSWSDGSNGSSITTADPGTYFVTIIDSYCNSTILSKTVTKGGVSDFIRIEPLCTGKIKLSVDGFESVKWSTGSEETSIEVGVSGAYEIEATDEGCTSTDKVNVIANASCQAPAVAALSASAICSDFPSLLRRWKISNPNTFKVRADWEIAGTIEKSWIDVPPGESYLTTIAIPFNQNLLKIYWHNEKGQLKMIQQTSIPTKCSKASVVSAPGGTTAKIVTDMKVFPNPTPDRFMLEITSEGEDNLPLQIVSSSGVVRYSGTIQVSAGQNFISHDVSQLENGTYVIRAGINTVRFMKK
jgi:hypothetical protein